MSDELKPCPFCGGKPYEAHHLTYNWWAVTCKCGAHGPKFRADTPEEHKCSAYQKATKAWNAATPEETARQLEREACAQVCEGMHDEDRPGDYANAIRSRGAA